MSTSPAPDPPRLEARLEAVLFVADRPVPLDELSAALDEPAGRVRRALDVLAERLEGGGLRLQRDGAGLRLVTAPEHAQDVARFLGADPEQRLPRTALETLAIVAYRQPVTRPQIEAVRGVNCDHAVAVLRARGLIEECGRADGPGRPTLWRTTSRFLEHFGLEGAHALPPLPEPEAAAAS